MSEPLLTMKEVCALLKVSELTVSGFIKQGLPCFRLANRYRFSEQEVLAWFKANAQRERPEARPRKPKAVLTRVNPPLDTLPLPEPAKISRPEPFPPLPIVDTPPERTPTPPLPEKRTENAPKAEKAIDSVPFKKNLRQMTMIEKAANLHKYSLHTLAVQTARSPESIAHTKQELMKACPLYSGLCCAERPAACPLTAYETLLKAKDGLK